MSDDSNTPPDAQGQARNGQARHAGNAEARWRALTSYPDFCQVGDKIVGFDSEATLGTPVNYSPNVITAGQRTYRVGDLCQGTEGNDGAGVGSGTSQGSGHVLFLTGQDNVKANGQPVVHDGSECTINCNSSGVGGAKGYVHTNTESVNSQPEEASEPLSVAEQLQQEAQANLERVGELRDALDDNTNGKTAAESEALYAQAQQLVSETQAQQEAFMEAHRAGIFRDNEMVESSNWVDEAANRASDMEQKAERQLSRSNVRGTWVDVAIGFNPVIGGMQLLEEVGDGIRSGQYGQAMLPVLIDSTPIGRSLGSMVNKVFGGFKKPKRVDRDSSSSSANPRESGQDNNGLRVEENSGSVEGGNISGNPDTIPEGVVYRRTDRAGEVAPYGGQAKSEARFIQRQREHARANPDSDFEFEVIGRAEPGVELDVLEHNFIQELTGGVAARKSPLVSNLKDPVGAARRAELGLPEPRSRP